MKEFNDSDWFDFYGDNIWWNDDAEMFYFTIHTPHTSLFFYIFLCFPSKCLASTNPTPNIEKLKNMHGIPFSFLMWRAAKL